MVSYSYYKVGGTIGFQDHTYVKREADQSLYEGLKAGDFCYILNSRQMGKSSLAIHTMARLKKEGYSCIFIDLSQDIGRATNADEWYYSLAASINQELKIDWDLSNGWDQDLKLSPLRKFREFIETIILKEITENIIILIDEINNVRCQSFNLDDFFAFIRSCYNGRMYNPDYQRLTFAIFGVATPTDLIQDPNQTPFNIGKEIELKGFTIEEVEPLIQGLKEQAYNPKAVLKQILYWTGGQPFLTQKLCDLVCQINEQISEGNEQQQIANLVQAKILKNWQQEDNPEHLRTIEDRILKSHQLAKILGLYQKILKGNTIIYSDNVEQMELRLSGLVVKEQNQLKVYNHIYENVFNLNWVSQELSRIRPYGETMAKWEESDKDPSWLLQGNALKEALQWQMGKNLTEVDYLYLSASQEFYHQKKMHKMVLMSMVAILGLLGIIGSGGFMYYRYGTCPVGQRIRGECFRYIMTSGNKPRLFVADTNFHLEQGVDFFRKGKYQQALQLFKQAIDAEPTDPVPYIYYNNAKARLQGRPLKLAVVAGIDFYESVAKDILRGVADAQTEFNERGGKNGRLLEIVIVNDGNEQILAKKAAQDLANQPDILGIIGHHSSESSEVAIPIYQSQGLAIVSPTSSSSPLKSEVFFRTVRSTKVAGEKYADYVKNNLNLDRLVIFYDDSSLYSKSLKKDFSTVFENLEGKILYYIDLNDPYLDIERELNNMANQNIKTILLIPSVKTSSVVIAIARENIKLPSHQRLQLLGAMSLSESPTLKNAKDAAEGMILASPCLNAKSQYSQKAVIKWQQKQVFWRTATSYDATQALIEAIRLSKEPTRAEILTHLKTLQLPIEKTSGFGLRWDSHQANANRQYCIVQIRHNVFDNVQK